MARAELRDRGKLVWAGETRFETPEELEAVVKQLAEADGLPLRTAALGVELESPLVQLRTIRGLPPVRSPELRSMVAVQSARFFRRTRMPLVTDACWAERGARKKGTAIAAACEERWLDAVIRGAGFGGLTVEYIRPANAPAHTRLGLIPVTERRRRSARALLSVRRLALAISAIWLAALAVSVVRLREERAAVDRELQRVRPAALSVANARRALGDLASIVDRLDGAEARRHELLARLTSLIASLPDSAFLTTLAIDASGQGKLVALARRSGQLLSAIDRQDAVISPRLEGGIVREIIGDRDWERFTVLFGPEGGP
jgi:hypothetical protein